MGEPAASLGGARRRCLLGAVIGLGVFAVVWVRTAGRDSSPAEQLGLLAPILLVAGGGVAGLVHSLTDELAARGTLHDYLRWGLVVASGMFWLGLPELFQSGTLLPALSTTTIGFFGGLGVCLTKRYLTARL